MLIPYRINTASLLSKYSLEEAADILVKMVRAGKIWFPYRKNFGPNPRSLFQNLKNINANILYGSEYRLYSYKPSHYSYLPAKFRDNFLLICCNKETFEKSDMLSDYFVEDQRLRAKRYDQKKSVWESWYDDGLLKQVFINALQKTIITPYTLRESMYKVIPETKLFNPTWAKALLKIVLGDNLEGLKWLDISSGWGDRLLVAMAMNMEYVGFDPNINLKTGHDKMIEMFGDNKKHKIIYEPFEKSDIPTGPYNVVLTSTPFFRLEEYVPDQKGQSIVSYTNKVTWTVEFLFMSLWKAWNNLKIGGHLILHLGDSKMIQITEVTNLFIQTYLHGSSWEGIIGLQGENCYPRPVWIWKKVDPCVVEVKRHNNENSHLADFYPIYANKWENIMSNKII